MQKYAFLVFTLGLFLTSTDQVMAQSPAKIMPAQNCPPHSHRGDDKTCVCNAGYQWPTANPLAGCVKIPPASETRKN